MTKIEKMKHDFVNLTDEAFFEKYGTYKNGSCIDSKASLPEMVNEINAHRKTKGLDEIDSDLIISLHEKMGRISPKINEKQFHSLNEFLEKSYLEGYTDESHTEVMEYVDRLEEEMSL